MEKNEGNIVSAGLLGGVAWLIPLKSITFLAAVGIIATAAWVWFRKGADTGQSFPVYGVIAGSYAAGFLIGVVFRRVLRIAAITAAILLGAFVLLHRANVDTSNAEHAVQAGSSWLKTQSVRGKEYLMHLLPSGMATAVGAFAGGRRRRS